MPLNKMDSRISSKRRELGLTQEDLALRIGVTRASVSQWENGTTSPKGKNLNLLSKALNVGVDWLVNGRPDESSVSLAAAGSHPVPILSYVQAGNWQSSKDFSGVDGCIEYVMADLDDGSRAFAVWVQGASMLPEFSEGDLIIIDPDVAPLPGDYVVAKNGGEECTFKKYRPRGHKEDGSEIFELVPLNDDYPTLRSEASPIQIIGTMIEHRKYRRRKR